MKNWKFALGLIACLSLLNSCASQPVFKPEVSGPGAMSYQGGVVYSVPPNNPVLKMKLQSLGINKENKLTVRMFFVRKGEPAGEFLDPKEQSIGLPDSSSNIYPSRVHANGEGKPMIKLASNPKQVVELEFLVPSGTHDFPYIKLNWKIHYKKDGEEKTMARAERFDLVEKTGNQEGVGTYNSEADFPHGYATYPEEWFTPAWLWW
jgi:hypothetical protein